MNDSGLTPVEFFVVVALDPTETKTPGGIILTEETLGKDELSSQEGTLIAASPHAFTYADAWPEGTVPQVGQRVLFKRYDGVLHERTVQGTKRKYRLLNDKSIIAIVANDEWAAWEEIKKGHAHLKNDGFTPVGGHKEEAA